MSDSHDVQIPLPTGDYLEVRPYLSRPLAIRILTDGSTAVTLPAEQWRWLASFLPEPVASRIRSHLEPQT
ncbi:hypothetical protein HNR42_002588 [Deinobacterium chartae]|uniref:Uncharacterized protein n=1 Tax=Deinobacterium chartae TaxID=521158 RepID=A0A841I5D1_9DEIO|nr:hypothetical protein [Deinobacterium chartae]MBB6099152.1 hypothetical protein [Deinobacterium chartae]